MSTKRSKSMGCLIRFSSTAVSRKRNGILPCAQWTIEVDGPAGDLKTAKCKFLMMCGGYYDYDKPHDPGFKNTDIFKGQLIHPQFWPVILSMKEKNRDYRKRGDSHDASACDG